MTLINWHVARKPLALTQGAAGALEIRLVLNRFEELNARVPVP